eukprot:13880711-Alexandrium_andersonii.AAC.1
MSDGSEVSKFLEDGPLVRVRWPPASLLRPPAGPLFSLMLARGQLNGLARAPAVDLPPGQDVEVQPGGQC